MHACNNPVAGYVGIGTTPPSTTLTVSGSVLTTSWTGINMTRLALTPLEVLGTISATGLVINGVNIASGGATDNITSGTTNVTVNSATSTISFTTAGVVANYLNNVGVHVTPGISVTTLNGVSSTNGYFSGNVGVGTTTAVKKTC